MSSANHGFITTNGIKMHFAEQGEGPLVVLCHGFPEIWYSWRHQLEAISREGFRVVAPDLRGYGQSDQPAETASYDVFHLVGDIVGLVHWFGEKRAAVIGNDWGSIIASYCALLRPDMFYAIGLMSVPYLQRSGGSVRPTEVMKRMSRDKKFYQLYFQEPGKAETELAKDVRKSLLMLFYSLSGTAPPSKRWRHTIGESETLLDTVAMPDALPEWLSDEDIDVYSSEFQRTGFRGGLNWYRNIDRNWELTSFLSGAKILQPSLFIAGGNDPVLPLYARELKARSESMPNTTDEVLLPDTGHWAPQERPEEVNLHLIKFLNGVV